jgi:hypothetical protein
MIGSTVSGGSASSAGAVGDLCHLVPDRVWFQPGKRPTRKRYGRGTDMRPS